MRNQYPLLLCFLLVVTSMSPALAGNSLEFDSAERAVQPRALIDFEVTSIEIGNSSRDAMQWEQPDGEIAEYIILSLIHI